MIKFNNLPDIALNNTRPAFYDVESVTVVELVDKLYKYTQNLIDNYNAFATDVQNEITAFEDDTNKNICDFKKCIMDLQSNFIESVDTKINLQNSNIAKQFEEINNIINGKFSEQDTLISNKFSEQDGVIANAVLYMKTNLVPSIAALFNDALDNGTIDIISYDSENEEITLHMVGSVGN